MISISFVLPILTILLAPGIVSNDSKLPKIVEKLAIKTRIEYSNGDKIKLRCPIIGTNPFKITWRKDGVFLEDSLARHYSITGKHGQYLRMKRMNDDDVGEYECKGTNGFGSKVFTFSVRKKGQSAGVELLSAKMTQGHVVKGETAELKCLLRGLGENDVVRWLKRLHKDLPESSPLLRDVIRIPPSSKNKQSKRRSFKRLDPNLSPRIHFKNTSYLEGGHRVHSFSLFIEETDLSDAGDYVCLAVEPLVDKKFKFNIGHLTVKDDPEGTSSGAKALLAWNKVTLWAIFIPVSFVLLVIPLICIILCLQPYSNDDSPKKEMRSVIETGHEHQHRGPGSPSPSSLQDIESLSTDDDALSHFYQPLSLRAGPIGRSTQGLPNDDFKDNYIYSCYRVSYCSK